MATGMSIVPWYNDNKKTFFTLFSLEFGWNMWIKSESLSSIGSHG